MNRKALVVGINTYTHLHSLNAPAADANAIADRLEQDGDFGVIRVPEAITQQHDQLIPTVGKTLSVTQVDLEKQLRLFFDPDSPQCPDIALFYFSGHGLRDPDGGYGLDKGYLATSDTDPNRSRSGISLAWLRNLVSRSPIENQIIWLDCCHSGGLLIDIDAANPGQNSRRNRCFIASSLEYETSWQDLNSPYSVLTKALLDGLDPTRSPESWIDTQTLVNHIKEAIRGELQSPVCYYFGQAINLTRSEQVKVAEAKVTIDAGICPYKGLEFFDLNTEDPKYFFGREKLTDQLLDHVRTENFMALVGASGNGKSSVLRAGLLHQLQEGRLPGSDQWQILIMRPDAQPMKNLATAFLPKDGSQLERADVLKHLSDGAIGLIRLVEAATSSRVVLVIDQFEEVFTRCEDITEREQFFACLMGALSETDNKLCLILAMRSDFVGKCLERDYSGLAQQVQQHMISVLPMNPEELKAAICKPAEQVGLQVEAALVTQMLNDIKGSPGYLPLLQYTLKELWQQRQDNQLVFSAYQKLGGIDGTLNKRATTIYNSFDAAEQRTVQHIFQQLTQLGEGTEDTRRRVFLDNLIAEPQHPAARVNQVIATLAAPENRLLVTSEVVSKGNDAERMAIVDVAHEALIRHWQLLRQWIEQNRDLLRQQRRIEASAVAWQEQGRSKGYLLQGLPLIEAKQFQKKQAERFPLSDPARTFIQKSIWQRRWNRLKTASWLIVPALLIGCIAEYRLREISLSNDYDRIIEQEGTQAERKAVIERVSGCDKQVKVRQGLAWLDRYITERLFGNCRSLIRAPLPKADLSNADLSNAKLSYADLSYAKLSYAKLSYADLSYAVLIEAHLFDADLSKAVLSEAHLSKAILGKANLSEAILSEAYLSSADLSFADFSGAKLSGAILFDAYLFDADLSYADLREAILREANLSSADFSSADLSYADLREANLSNADLSYAILVNTDLSSADFSYALLIATNLHESENLNSKQLTGENQPYLCGTGLPSNINIKPNRDCDNPDLAQFLTDRYSYTTEEAQQIIDQARSKQWE
ncbi:MAG: nSTAND1 domain-containing NTPase [Thainema sp.]